MSYVSQSYWGYPLYPIWAGVSSNTQMTYVAAAYGYAMLNTPHDGSLLKSTVSLFFDYIHAHNSTNASDNVKAVLNHHNFQIP